MYDTINFFLKMYDKNHRKMPADLSSKENFEAFRIEARKKLEGILRLNNIPKLFKNEFEIAFEKEIDDDIILQEVVLSINEDEKMPIDILIPKAARNNPKAKPFICFSGHQGGGMASIIGDRSHPLVSEAIDKFNYDYGLELAKRGYVAICPETIGFGKRREERIAADDQILQCSCYSLARLCNSFGMNLLGLIVYEMQCLIDYLFTRGEWDLDSLSGLGFSGGGMQLLYLAALDDRVKNVIISGYMYGYKEAHTVRNGNCSCNYAEGLWESFDMGDVASLIAPRKFVVQSGDSDHLNGASGIKNVMSQIDIIKGAYSLYDKDIVFDICEGAHKWYKEKLDSYLEYFF